MRMLALYLLWTMAATAFTESSAAVRLGTISAWERPQPGWLWVLDIFRGARGVPGTPQILLVDPESGRIRAKLPTTGGAEMALSSEGNRFYIATGSELSIIDAAVGNVIANLPLYSRWMDKIGLVHPTMAMSPDGRWIYIYKIYGNSPANAKYTVASFDTMSGTFLPSELEIECPVALFLPVSTGRSLPLICAPMNEIRFLELDQSGAPATIARAYLPKGTVVNPEIVRTLPVGSSIWDLRTGAVAPDGRTIAAVMGDGKILEVDRATRTIRRVIGQLSIKERWVPERPAVYSRDGSRLYVAVGRLATRSTGRGEEILVVDSKTGQQMATIETSIPFVSLAISKDGRYLYAPAFDDHNPPSFEGRIIVIDALDFREIRTMQDIGMWPAYITVQP